MNLKHLLAILRFGHLEIVGILLDYGKILLRTVCLSKNLAQTINLLSPVFYLSKPAQFCRLNDRHIKSAKHNNQIFFEMAGNRLPNDSQNQKFLLSFVCPIKGYQAEPKRLLFGDIPHFFLLHVLTFHLEHL